MVQLTSSDPSALWVPSSVTVPAGQAWAAFEVRGGSVAATTPVTVTATQDGASLVANVTVLRPGAGLITGMIADAGKLDGDFPLAGATVSVENGPAATITDASGAFSLYADPGTVRILAAKTNYVSGSTAPLTLPASGTVSAGVLKLTRQMAGSYYFDGTVVDTNGAAVAGATVQAEGYAGSVTTDAAGKFRILSPEAANRLRLTVTKEGFPARTEDIRATGPVLGGGLFLEAFILSSSPRAVLDGFWLEPAETRYPGGAGMHFRFAGGTYPSSGVNVWLTFSNTEAVEAIDIASLSGSYDPRWDSVPVKVRGVTKPAPVLIRASYGGVTKEATLVVHPASTSHLTGVKLSPSALTSGQTGTVTVTIDPPADIAASLEVTATGPGTVPAYVPFVSGASSVAFAVTAQTVSSAQTARVTVKLWGETLTLEVPVSPSSQARLSGIGPAGVVAGSTITVWGTGFAQSETVEALGPVYGTTGGTALCTIPACPVNQIPASLEASGTSLLTLVPNSLSPGIYLVRTRNGGTTSQNGLWLLVDDPTVTYAPLLPEERSLARKIRPGKTVIGEFVENGDPYGQTGDYALYYFTATAGSRVSLSLEREDTSKTWEHPESIDPKLTVTAPSGYVTEALFSEDIRPSVDLNARIADATLPETGIYVVTAETSRGKGRYRLTFDVLGVAPSAERSIPASGQGVTLSSKSGSSGNAKALWVMLDPKGNPAGGASVGFQDIGEGTSVTFSPTASLTSLDGFVAVTATLKGSGVGAFRATLADSVMNARNEEIAPMTQPDPNKVTGTRIVERRPFVITWVRPDGTAELKRKPGKAIDTGLKGTERPPAIRMTPNSPAGCRRDPGVMRQLGIPDSPAPGPWKIQLTDVTRQSEVTEQPGIEGHRVEKEIRLKLTVRDANGNEVKHPVWVELALGGTQPGKLILDPDTTPTQCEAIGFVWHERDGRGIPKENGTIGYRLGTKSVLTGFLPDATKPYGVKPVWADMEALRIRAMGVNGQGEVDDSTFSEQFFAVRPEPGKPESLVRRNLDAQILPDELRYWSGHLLKPAYPGNQSGPNKVVNLYLLEDRFGNVIYGQTNTGVSSPQANVQASFVSQAPDGGMAGHYYSTSVTWNDTPSLPQGDVPITLAVNYPPDPDWSAGTVTKTLTLKFDGGVQKLLVKPTYSYDLVKPDGNKGTDDGTFPLSVSPGSTQEGLPRTPQGDAPRLSLLTIQGDQTVGLYDPKPEPTLTGTRMWVAEGADHFRIQETRPAPALDAGTASFKFTLVDEQQKPVPEGEFLVHVCPRFDHESAQTPRPCEQSPSRSTNGVIESVSTLPGWGYLGVELTKAPIAPGLYYVKVESIGQTHRIRIAAERWDEAAGVANEFVGSFGVCQVRGLTLLDESFAAVTNPLNLSIDRSVYVREIDDSSEATDYRADVVLADLDGGPSATLQNVAFRRLGKSPVYQTDLIAIASPDPPATAPEPLPEPRLAPRFLPRQSTAGTLYPTRGRFVLKRVRPGQPSDVLKTYVSLATTRLVEITDATPNFDGVTPGRESIRVTTNIGADGQAGVVITNVNSSQVFTFDFWEGQRLTTDLTTRPMVLAPSIDVQKNQVLTFPTTGQGFVPLISENRTLNPGLYRIRAEWRPRGPSMIAPDAGSLCVTDKPQYQVCLNEWIISVGARLLIDVTAEAQSDLQGYLDTVQAPLSPNSRITAAQFLDTAMSEVASLYREAGANIAISTDSFVTRPALRHRVRRQMSVSSCSQTITFILYGCTPTSAGFPLIYPDIDTAPDADEGSGISLWAIYHAPAFDTDPAYKQAHEPLQPRNATGPWTATNPSPTQVFVNRFVNIVGHETAHSLGLMAPAPFRIHGAPTQVGSLLAVEGFMGLGYGEAPLAIGTDRGHEPLLISSGGFGYARDRTNSSTGEVTINPGNHWIMQPGIYRWVSGTSVDPGHYDQVPEPEFWLLFDRPLRFSRTQDFVDSGRADQSIELFFRERLPLCEETVRSRSCNGMGAN